MRRVCRGPKPCVRCRCDWHKRNERERSSPTAHDTQTLKERMLVGSVFSLVFLELVLELVDLDCHLSVAHGG
jgi:hypothetical protein